MPELNVKDIMMTASGASASRSLGARAAGEVMSAAEFGVVADADPAVATAAFLRMLDFVEDNGARVFTLPAGPINIGVPAANLVGTNEGTAFKLLAQHSNLILRGIPGLTRLVPVSNKIEMFAQAGATDLVFEDIICDNSANGQLQNQVKSGSISVIGGGVAQLGNGACAFIRQYTGANLTVRRCGTLGITTAIHYIGEWTDISELSGTLNVEEPDFDDYSFGLLVEQPRVMITTKIKSRNRTNSVNADSSVDPGHDVYVTNRPGASPSLILVDGVLAEGGGTDYANVSRASSIKVRKGQVVTITNVNAINNGKGVEVFNSQNVTVTNCSVKLIEDDADTNQAAYEFRDCGSLEYDNLIADIRGVDAWGLRIIPDQDSQTWHNTNVSGGRIKVKVDYSLGGIGKAPVIASGQTDIELRYPRVENFSSTANSRYPVDVRACTRASVVFPSQRAPEAPADAYKLVSFDVDCVDCSVIYRDKDIDTAVIGSTISDLGTGTVIARLPDGSFKNDGSIQVGIAGSASAPALGLTASGDYFGWYRPASGNAGLSINGTLITSFTATRQILYGSLTPDAAGNHNIGTSLIPFSAVFANDLQAKDAVNGWTGTVSGNGITFSRGGTNYIQSATAGSSIVIDAQSKTSLQYQGDDIIKADANGATIGGASGKVGFFATSGAVKGTISGSRGGNAALASLLTYLASLNLLVDSSSA